MVEINTENIVDVYNEVLDHDNRPNGVRVYVYGDKNDFIDKYVEDNLMNMKISEPISGEKYEDKFKKYVEEVNMIIKPFDDNEIIIVGLFGKDVSMIDIGNTDTRVYKIDEIDLLKKDIQAQYN